MSYHHVEGVASCPLCELKLKDAHPLMVGFFRDYVKAKFPQAHISWTFRDEKNQNDCFASGKSKLRWPLSKHNALADGKPCARAIDLFMIVKGQALWPESFFRQVADLCEEEELPIYWGGNWKKFPDGDHFELLCSIV